MTRKEFEQNIVLNDIPSRWYSLNGGLKADACILYQNYAIWEYFYLDEKGERHDMEFFKKEEEAYEHLWGKLEYQLNILRKRRFE